ncbi:MAG: SDR family oxidoreductase [Chloroflexi bacterium]|nr:SDR family oxidoreductase [Chloroflexota bacterium]
MPLLSQYDLSGKTAILSSTGGDESPLLASVLAEAGATVFAVTRRQEQLDAILSALEGNGSSGGKHGGVAVPLVSDDAVSRAMAEFDRLDRPVDILVNDNRSLLAKPTGEITLSEWDELQSRNVRTAFLLSQAVGLRMIERESGRIVNLISGLAERGMMGGSAFSVSQAGLLALTRSLAVEWGRHNIRVNAIGVGWSISEDVPLEIQREEQLVRYTPLRRKGHPRDIGPLLVYLCSDACDYTTGQPIYIDGGLNAHP